MDELFYGMVEDIVKNSGLFVKVIFTLLFGMGMFFIYMNKLKEGALLYDIIKSKLSNKKDKTNNVPLTQKKLFSSKPYFLNACSNTAFNDAVKENIFKTILYNKVEVVIDSTEALIKSIDINTISTHEVVKIFLTHTLNVQKEYEEVIKNKLDVVYGKKLGKELYKFVYSKGFRPYHQTRVNFIIEILKNYLNSTEENSSYDIASFYIDTLFVALSVALADIMMVFTNYNGSIKKMVDEDKFYNDSV